MAGAMLNFHTWGHSDCVALLLHGMAGSSGSWSVVGPALAETGLCVLAVDLPGHGASAPDPTATGASVQEALARSVPQQVNLAVGHSMGGTVLARALADGRLAADAAIFVEAPFQTPRSSRTREHIRESYAQMKATRTADWLRQHRPEWSDTEVAAEAEAARQWDIDTAASLSAAAQGSIIDLQPDRPSLIIRAEPSDVIDHDAADELIRRGFTVVAMPGAGHTVWHGRTEEFLTIIDMWRSTSPTP